MPHTQPETAEGAGEVEAEGDGGEHTEKTLWQRESSLSSAPGGVRPRGCLHLVITPAPVLGQLLVVPVIAHLCNKIPDPAVRTTPAQSVSLLPSWTPAGSVSLLVPPPWNPPVLSVPLPPASVPAGIVSPPVPLLWFPPAPLDPSFASGSSPGPLGFPKFTFQSVNKANHSCQTSCGLSARVHSGSVTFIE
ncbi:inverted formin-2-like isoform X2 [Acanthochromis polyacanthus]|uniref:inverted formin-2-like isoform X2 n=1 Tax=Acanthochromis polyacanthus TaxID=80966 RepID=UPI002234A637|nr:inverted formin-2-like isoform X2 [Acanthochromis polyacanthus]